MPNLGVLTDTVGMLTGDRRDITIRARYLREKKILSTFAKRTTIPQIETVYAVSLLFAALKAGPQVDSVRAVMELWHLPGYATQFPSHSAEVQPPVPFADINFTFGQFVASFIEQAASSDKIQREWLARSFSTIAVARDIPFAQIMYPDGRIHYFEALQATSVRLNIPKSIIRTATSAGVATIEILGDLVRRSRQDAERLGITIPTEDAYHVLGLLPSGGPGQPAKVPGINPSWLELAPTDQHLCIVPVTTNENAALAGAAPTRIQDHDLATPAVTAPEDTREREISQASLSRGPGPSPNRHRKEPHHGRSTDTAAGPGG